MRSHLLKLIKCPYCGSEFKFQVVVDKNGEDVIFGCINCECSEFPIVEGILILKAGPLSKHVVKLVKERKTREAAIHCFGWEDFQNLYASYVPFRFSYKVQSALGRVLSFSGYHELFRENSKVYKNYSDKSLPFCDVLGKGEFDVYLRNRFSTFSFWSNYAFLPLLKTKRGRILDLSCGAGHGSFVVSKYVETDVHCCADSCFRLLFLARKYFAQKAEFVCLDANNPLPFKARTFDTILMSDAFHYVYARASLAREMERAIRPGGLILLTHLHNSLADNGAAGYPLTPKAYAALFSCEIAPKIMPEKAVVESFLIQNKLDLQELYSDDELNSSNAIILMATSDPSLFKLYDRADLDFLSLKNHLVINPLYEIHEKNDSVLLVRSPAYDGSSFFEDYYPFTKEYLPAECEIGKQFVRGRKVNLAGFERADELMKRFVAINVPENYLQ